MGFGQPAEPQTPLKLASSRSAAMIGPSGYWRGTSAPVSIKSRTHGWWPIFPWNKPCSRNGSKRDIWKTIISIRQKKVRERRGIISPAVANMTLDGLERLLASHFSKTSRVGRRAKVNLIRSADDFCVTGSSKELLEQQVKPLIEQFLKERGLELSAEKTVVTHIEQGFDFLGQTVRKYQKGKRPKFFIPPSKKNVKTFLRKIRKRIKESRDLTAGELIAELNPHIRGWALYHRHVVSAAIYQAVDHAIFQAIWKWARRRHRNKPRRWVKDKYFPDEGPNRWVFTGVLKGEDGQVKVVRLLAASSMRIERQTKIRAEANPYDPAWETYARKTPRRADGSQTQRETMAQPSLEGAKRSLPYLSPEDHQDYRMAQSSPSLAIHRRIRSGRKPRTTSPNLSSTSS